jgi:hypothetical protein
MPDPIFPLGFKKEFKLLIYWSQQVVWTFAAAPVIARILSSVVQAFTIERAVNVFNPFLLDRLRQTSMHFCARTLNGVSL